MNEDEYKEAVRDALMREINRLKSTMAENRLIGNTFVQSNLISNIKANVHSQARGLVPENNKTLFQEGIKTLEREKIVVIQGDGSLLIV
jgi:hypothetical protein